jgi:Cu+-exporting ATPase
VTLAVLLYIPVGLLVWVIPYSHLTSEFLTSMIWWRGNPLYIFIMFLLSTVYLFYIGQGFFISAYKSLKHKSANMDVLIVIGTTAAWLYGTILLA